LARADHITWLHHGSRRVTRWGNLGLWRAPERGTPPISSQSAAHTASTPTPTPTPTPPKAYATACADLARAVGHAAGMQRGDTVLCLACGGGEELALWAEDFGAVSVMALELSPALAAQARSRAEANLNGCVVDVYCADARHLARQVGGRFHRIVCVDAVYHLGPRAPLVRAAYERLHVGGGLAWTDLVLEPAPGKEHGARLGAGWRRAALRAGARLAGIELAELRSVADTLALWREAGFDDVRATRLDDEVLAGFCAHARRQARRLPWHARTTLSWLRVVVTTALIRVGRPAGLGYALFSARVKPKAESFGS
jgi:SAM-dependent methyltransferase